MEALILVAENNGPTMFARRAPTRRSNEAARPGAARLRHFAPLLKFSSRLTRPAVRIIRTIVPSHSEGRLAIVTDAGRDAMDAGGASDEGAGLRTAKSCGPDTPTLVSSWRSYPPMTVTRKPGSPGRARSSLLKPLRGECRVIPV